MLFKEMFVGTLIYAVVLGFFDDYTSIVNAGSFSTIFFAAFILQILTYLTFELKNKVLSLLSKNEEKSYPLAKGLSIWFIMFSSKFVFIWVVDFIFGSNISINGFFGVLWLVLSVTVIHKLADHTFKKLGETS